MLAPLHETKSHLNVIPFEHIRTIYGMYENLIQVMTPHHMLNAIYILFMFKINTVEQCILGTEPIYDRFYYCQCFADGVNSSIW